MSEKKPFQWAADPTANLQEPIENLKKKGWQYGAVPTASNFNWLFNDIQKELEGHSEQLKTLAGMQNALASVSRKVDSLEKEMTYLLPTVVEIIRAINMETVTQLIAQHPFRYKDGKRPTPIPISPFGLNAEDSRDD